jgi:hypothetical protein
MGPKELELLDGTVIRVTQIPPNISKILWATDPARLKRFDPAILAQFRELNLQYEVKTAQLKAELKKADLDLNDAVNKLIR